MKLKPICHIAENIYLSIGIGVHLSQHDITNSEVHKRMAHGRKVVILNGRIVNSSVYGFKRTSSNVLQ